jgi:hypothetical protein
VTRCLVGTSNAEQPVVRPSVCRGPSTSFIFIFLPTSDNDYVSGLANITNGGLRRDIPLGLVDNGACAAAAAAAASLWPAGLFILSLCLSLSAAFTHRRARPEKSWLVDRRRSFGGNQYLATLDSIEFVTARPPISTYVTSYIYLLPRKNIIAAPFPPLLLKLETVSDRISFMRDN